MTRRLAFIPARGGSQRVPKKNIREFCGRPMLAYAIAAAEESGLFDHIHVSTDSAEVAEVAARFGHAPRFLRPAAMGENEYPLLEVLRWTLAELAKDGETFDDVCLLLATAPLIEADDLRQGYQILAEGGRDLPVLSVGAFPSPVERALKVKADGTLEWVFPEMRLKHSQELTTSYYDAGAFLWFSVPVLTAQEQPVFSSFRPYVLPHHRAVDINTNDDFLLAEIMYRGSRSRD